MPLPSQPNAKFRIQRDPGWFFSGEQPPVIPTFWSGQVFSMPGNAQITTDSEIYYNNHYTWPPWCNNGKNTPDPAPPWWHNPRACPVDSPAKCFGFLEEYAGWPTFALCSREWVTQVRGIAGGISDPYSSSHGQTIASQGTITLSSIRFLPQSIRTKQFPIIPVWPGFAADAAMLASLAWGVSRLPFILRRFVRKRNNHCLRCGYDRSGLASDSICPECGKRNARPNSSLTPPPPSSPPSQPAATSPDAHPSRAAPSGDICAGSSPPRAP